LARLGDSGEDECEDEAREEAADHPREIPQLSADQRSEGAAVTREDERAKRAGKPIELVEREEGPCRGEREQEPAAEVGAAQDDREPGEHDRRAREETGHRPPKRRRRLA
jgi:hypothetical protein